MAKSYTLEPDEKAIPVMAGTPDMLLWGDLVLKEHVRFSGFLNTLAEDFVPIHDAKVLFLAPVQQVTPVNRSTVYVKREEILFFYEMTASEPLPEETEVRVYDQVELVVGPYQIEGSILKSPIAELYQMMLVAKDAYLAMYKATIRHVAKPWLGAFTTTMIQVRRDRLTLMVS